MVKRAKSTQTLQVEKFLHDWYQDWDIPNPRVVEGFSDFRKNRAQKEFKLAGGQVSDKSSAINSP